ncbi:hypothetical protein L1N85_26430, partial [Paenibacillus alkaliterrae]|uniref:hypothetical protein n=1 Tax=Paenibacillus alkaliterrae TaxID=320909 RepID=UPI001F25BBDF
FSDILYLGHCEQPPFLLVTFLIPSYKDKINGWSLQWPFAKVGNSGLQKWGFSFATLSYFIMQ